MYKVVYTMKKYFNILKICLVFALFFSIHTVSLAQPPPPPPSIGHGGTGNVPGSGAPIGEGVFFLIGLAGIYGGKKMYDLRKPIKAKEV
jgi:hypothetical protein